MRALSTLLSSPRNWRWMAVALLACASLAQAQTQPPPDDGSAGGDPPSRVARLSYRTGDVNLLPSGEKDWGDASLNRPLTTGDRLSTGQAGRAELELGGGTLRIADDTDFGFLTLNDQVSQVELTQGTLNLAVRGLAEGQSYEIDTPTVALVVDQPGTYRVDISDDGKSTRITDFDGHAVVYGEGGAQRSLVSGRTYEFGDSSLNNVTISDTDGGDDFDAWCNSRDRRYAESDTSRYVSSDVVGAQDLDQYGNWQADPEYGQVWYPSNVAADWAPYRDGHWAYVGPWGWTWVDDSPWGFAPYHYGRWAYVRSRWCWVPGPVSVRPVYAPALVAFVGGAGFGVSVGIGAAPVGWFPLGPGEIYNPWYRASRGYYTNVNVTNIYVRNNRQVVINNINNHYNYFREGRPMPNERYFNREAPRAFTAMSRQDFASARNAQQHQMAVDPRRFANAPVMARGADVQPGRASFVPPRNGNERGQPGSGFNREVVARNAPAASFAGRPQGNASPGTPRNVPTASNVRMLNGPSAGNRPGAPGRTANSPEERAFSVNRNNGAGPNQPAAPNNEPSARFNRPQPEDNRAAGAPDMRRQAAPNESNVMRPAELPSARFARPQGDEGRTPPNERGNPGNQPRPGVSYIPSAEADRAMRAQPQPGTLPNTPRFERAQPTQDSPRAVPNQDNAERFQRENAAPRQEPQQPRFVQQPREVQAPREAPQQREMQAPREMPQPREAPQERAYQPPRGYEPPRPNPQPQQQPRPAQNSQPQQRPSGGHEDRHPPKKDDQHN
ncbi:MAG: FecR domain-containing protein [Dyella sp.]|nr:FecR domain-containing protein [Dyella sp.]